MPDELDHDIDTLVPLVAAFGKQHGTVGVSALLNCAGVDTERLVARLLEVYGGAEFVVDMLSTELQDRLLVKLREVENERLLPPGSQWWREEPDEPGKAEGK